MAASRLNLSIKIVSLRTVLKVRIRNCAAHGRFILCTGHKAECRPGKICSGL